MLGCFPSVYCVVFGAVLAGKVDVGERRGAGGGFDAGYSDGEVEVGIGGRWGWEIL